MLDLNSEPRFSLSMGYLYYLEIVQMKCFGLLFGLESLALFYASFWYLITVIEVIQRSAFFKELQEHCELIDKFLRKYGLYIFEPNS